jgi:hypothetical protein
MQNYILTMRATLMPDKKEIDPDQVFALPGFARL